MKCKHFLNIDTVPDARTFTGHSLVVVLLRQMANRQYTSLYITQIVLEIRLCAWAHGSNRARVCSVMCYIATSQTCPACVHNWGVRPTDHARQANWGSMRMGARRVGATNRVRSVFYCPRLLSEVHSVNWSLGLNSNAKWLLRVLPLFRHEWLLRVLPGQTLLTMFPYNAT